MRLSATEPMDLVSTALRMPPLTKPSSEDQRSLCLLFIAASAPTSYGASLLVFFPGHCMLHVLIRSEKTTF